MPTLLLVDGSSYLFRAFHALPDLRSPQGEPTGALYGMIGMLKRLAADFPADYIACVFDAKGKTFRDEWYPEYKASRAPMPDDLAAQIEPIHSAVRALGDNRRKALDWLPKAKQLVTIKTDVPLPVDIDELRPQAPDDETLLGLYEKYGFRTWRKELQQSGAANQAEVAGSGATHGVAPTRDYETILTEAQLEAWLEKFAAAQLVWFDTETTGLNPMTAQIVGLSFAYEPGKAAYLPLTHRYQGAPQQLPLKATLARLKPWFEDAACAKLGQNAKYDMHVLANHGIEVKGVAHDTLLQSYVLEAHKPHDMDSMALRWLDINTIKFEEVAGKGASQIGFDQVSVERATEYSAEDADVTLQLHHAMHPKVAAEAKLDRIYATIEIPVMQVLFRMERNSVMLDTAKLVDQSHELGHEMMALERKAQELAGQPFNL